MPRSVQLGDHELTFGSKYLTELRDSSDLLDDGAALRERFAEDGYLFVRGLHETTRVTNARNELLQDLDRQGKLDPGRPLEETRVGDDNEPSGFASPDIDYCEYERRFPNVVDLVESDRVFSFFERFLGESPLTFNYKWTRAVPTGAHTDFHYDSVFMGRGTDDLYTMWTPLDDTPLERGPLVVCAGSHEFDDVRKTYGQVDVARQNVDVHFTDPFEIVDEFGGRWAAAPFEAGDAIVFGQYTFHGALTNTTDRYRLSTDTRYQSREKPVDGRFVGAQAAYANAGVTHEGDPTPLEEARSEWGI